MLMEAPMHDVLDPWMNPVTWAVPYRVHHGSDPIYLDRN
jgi:hypothetical protein